MKKNIYFYTNLLAWALVFLLASNYAFGWVTPSANPPSSNLPAPINVSSTAQSKEGYLAIRTSTAPEVPLHVVGNVFLPSGNSYWIGTHVDSGDRLRMHQTGTHSYIDYATGNLNIRAGTATKVVIDSSGNVGIGTTTPKEKLDVRGILRSGAGDGMFNVEARSSTYGSETIALQTTIDNRKISDGYVGAENRYVLALQPDYGNVGIGTTSPGKKLDVNGDIRTNVALISDDPHGTSYVAFSHRDQGTAGGYALLQHSAGETHLNAPTGKNIRFRINNADKMILNSDGNVGIGTTGPNDKLDIIGWTDSTSGYKINGKKAGEWGYSASIETTGWYRIASNSGNRANALFTLRDYISGGGHSTLTFRAGTSYNYATGMSFTVLNHNYYSTPTFTKVRILHATTYDPQYIEVYVNRTGNMDFTIYDNMQSAGFVPVNWTAGSIPTDYTAREFDVNNLFVVGDYDDRFTINRGGNVGIGTTSPGAKLEVAGQIKITGGTPGANKVLTSDAAGLATWQTSSGGVPPGTITAYGGTSAPSGWILCNGSAVSRTTYADLFAVLSTTYGAGDGSTTFNVPDLRQRFPLGKADSGTGSTLGGTGGAIDHTHTGPRHTHTYSDVIAHTHSINPPATTSASGGASHRHTVNPPSTNTNTTGAHSHTYYRPYQYSDATGASSTEKYWWYSKKSYSTSSSGSHYHSVNIPAFYSGYTTASHTHSVDIAAFTSGSTGSASGRTAASGTGATGSNNPPYLVVNYIIKY